MRDENLQEQREEIAIIGMAGRFPGARSVEEFWRNLCDGVESVSTFTAEDLKGAGIDPAVLGDPAYVNAGTILEDADAFDASFFGFSPREAEITDPQHRVFLECAWEAIESAGYDPEAYDGLIGVYGGVARNTYFLNNVAQHQELINSVGSYQMLIGSEKDFPATRVSYKLNLRGPSINVQTACSTSGVALHLACQSLLGGECDMALAGGARIQVPLKAGYFYQEGGILSPDGHCRAFDARARGTVIGSGAAIVVLKRLTDALRDGDCIHAIIKGSAINNDGSIKVGFTAPGVEGQARVIAEAHAVAEIEADTISYVEAHGTGTSLGDPIEIAALTKSFRENTWRKSFCAIGSVKTNIGHLDAGAGVTGLIKTALALKHKLLPPSLNYEQPNPQIDFENSPFYVNTKLSEWRSGDTPRRAGVSSFGLGGTNAHIVLEEPPAVEPSGEARPWQLLLLSAKTDSALERATANLAEHLRKNPDLDMADVAYTLQVGRKVFGHRRMLVCRDLQDAANTLQSPSPKRVVTDSQGRTNPPVAFMFPGGGAQYINMGSELYCAESAFRRLMHECFEIIKTHLDVDLVGLVYPEPARAEESAAQLTKPSVALPALFASEYALAKLLMSWGIRPTAMIGHSLGEYTAGCLAGVISLEDALAMVVLRGQLFERLADGAMLSVPLPEEEVRALTGENLSIAAVNGSASCVVSGGAGAIEEMAAVLAKREIEFSRLHISVAAHSRMVEPILEEFGRFVRGIRLRAPSIPYISNVTGTWITAAEATDAGYWARHLRQTVRFSDGLQVLLKESDQLLLEVGPGQTLSTFARQHPDRTATQSVLASLRHPKEMISDVAFLLNTVGRLWLAGVKVDWPQFHTHGRRRRMVLPTYPFERKRFWLDPCKTSRDEELLDNGSRQKSKQTIPRGEEGTPIVTIQNEKDIPMSEPHINTTASASRKERILPILLKIVHDLSGRDFADDDVHATFLELGFDSLFLTQANAAFQKKFKVKITFRQLFEEAPSLDALAAYVDSQLPPEAFPAEIEQPPACAPQQSLAQPAQQRSLEIYSEHHAAVPASATEDEVRRRRQDEEVADAAAFERIMAQQLQVMSAQLEVLRGYRAGAETLPSIEAAQSIREREMQPRGATNDAGEPRALVETNLSAATVTARAEKAGAKSFGPWKPIEKGAGGGLTARQQKHLDALIARFTDRTRESKRLTQAHRASLADPRTVAGFRLPWKEMVYPIVVTRASGSKLWDVDGNEWTDITMGFGVSLFGHSPTFVVEAVEEQLKNNMAIGPQSPLAGKVAELISELTDMPRVAFCNTGSEAVLAALRVARTVTGRTKIATFSGDYHGIFDEMLVKGITIDGTRRSVPVAPGIPSQMVEDVLMLDYGDPASLEIIEAYAGELAAVLVEPVQSRRPDLQPREFLHSLRELTRASGTPLIFDEVVTGFRLHPGGAQAWFGVEADLATYGKVIGGGMPIGVVAGKAEYMDALDGGAWSYGDASVPEVGVTWFAGTFVRHPLALAAVWAVLNHLKKSGPQLQQILNEKTSRFADELNDFFGQNDIPIRIVHFSSFFTISFKGEQEFAGLFAHHLREKGVHTHESRPNFLTTAHSEEDMAFLARAFKEAALEMRRGGFLPDSLSGSSGKSEPGADQGHGTEEELPARLNILAERPAGNGNSPDPHGKANVARQVPLTPGQMEIWLAARAGDDPSCAFIISSSARLKGRFNATAMRQSIQRLIDRHEALRTTFSEEGDFQRIATSLAINVPVIDLSAFDENTKQARVRELIENDSRQPFDLANGPLLRASVVKLGDEHHQLVLTAHHIICDGWSVGILMKDLGVFYSSACDATNAQTVEPMQFSEYAAWQQERQRNADGVAAEAYWLERYSSPVPTLDLPADRLRPPVKTYNARQQRIVIDAPHLAELKQISARSKCTMFAVFLAAYEVLLHRLSGQEDLVVGLAVAGQSSAGNKNLVGHCVNLLPFRSRISGDQFFSDYLASTKRLLLDAYDYRDYTFGSLINKLNLPRDPSRLPVASTIMTYETAMAGINFANLDATVVNNPKSFCNFDLELYLTESNEGLAVEFHYNRDLFDDETIGRWLIHFKTLLEAIVANPEQRLSDLPLLTEAERHRLVVEWNDTGTEYPMDGCVHQLFEAQVERTPQAVAVVGEDERVTYGELNRRANQLAHYLRRQGVGPEVLVGICVERTIGMLVAVLGILKAGGAYVPLDLSYPKERLLFMLEDAQVAVLLTETQLAEKLPETAAEIINLGAEWIVIEQQNSGNPICSVSAENLAYVVYTSGSTGKPKGVAIEHRSTVALLDWAGKSFTKEQLGGVLASTSVCFDLSVFEMFAPLISGGKVILAKNALELPTLSAAGEVTLLNTVPSAIVELLRIHGIPSSVNTINLAGEPLPQILVRQIYRQQNVRQLFDLYGPTESTTYSTFTLRTPDAPAAIGRPIANTQVYILDGCLQPQPVGVPGELYIGGAGLARGYLNRPELTAERFIPNPFDHNAEARMYKTGDLARYLPDGQIEFLGRLDQQVKVRGYRIELGEIEATLAAHPAVRECVVLSREDKTGEKRLVAYIVVEQGTAPSFGDLRGYVKQKLPEYMVPSAYEVIDKLPLTANGKVDRKALPAFDQSRLEPQETFIAPRNELERRLVKMWEDVLGVYPIGVRDNFFEVGGHSLLALRLFTQIQKAFGIKLPLAILFQAPTVEQLASALGGESLPAAWSPLVAIQPAGSKRPFFCVHALDGNVIEYYELARHLGQDQPFYALQSPGLDGKQKPHSSMKDMAAHYIDEIRKVQPEGPYLLGGWSLGGTIAFEMACQLEAQGHEVALLAFLDSAPPGYRRLPSSDRTGEAYLSAKRVKRHLSSIQQLRFKEKALYLSSKARGYIKLAGNKLWEMTYDFYQKTGRPLPRALQNVIHFHDIALRDYVPQIYSGRAALFCSSAEPEEVRHRLECWKHLAVGGVEVYIIQSDHFQIIKEPYVQILAEELTTCLEQAQRARPDDPKTSIVSLHSHIAAQIARPSRGSSLNELSIEDRTRRGVRRPVVSSAR